MIRNSRVLASRSGQFGRFLIIGVFNTVNGYASVLFLQLITGMPVLSNMLGFIFSGVIGYLAHSVFTFRTKASGQGAVRYAVVLGGSYLVNLIALNSLMKVLSPVPSQLIAVTIFTLLCYLGQSRITFKS